jgi:hypothetical protein
MAVRYFIPYGLFECDKNADGALLTGVDGSGRPVDGRGMPMFDTLLGVYNPNPVAVTFEVYCYRRDGTVVMWPDGTDCGKWTLQPGHKVATTFIKNNVWPNPAQDWTGYIEITSPEPVPVYAMLGGGGLFWKHWNLYSPHVPVYVDQDVPWETRRMKKKSRFVFPYSIPFFRDANHGPSTYGAIGDFTYCTALVLTNFDYDTDVYAHCTFVVGDVYPDAGSQCHFVKSVLRRTSIGFDVYTEGLLTGGYPQGRNAEGAIDIRLRQTEEPSSPEIEAWFAPYLICQNYSYNALSAGQAYS